MILTLNDLVVWIVIGSFFLICVFSLVSRFLHIRKERAIVRERTICRLCGHVYRNEDALELSHCELCGALNRRTRNGKLG